MSNIVLAFDLYGTILDTSTISEGLKEILPLLNQGENVDARMQSIVSMWRTLQLEYTWRLNSMESYMPFSTVTTLALQSTLANHSLPALSPEGEVKAAHAYNSLSPFRAADDFFTALANRSETKSLIFTNGTREMVRENLLQIGGGGGDVIRSLFLGDESKIVSVDDSVRRFKPHPKVYEEVIGLAGVENARDVVLVSCNPFDVVGALKCGLRVVWVDRAGKGWTDRLGGTPTWTVKDLGEIMWILDEEKNAAGF